MEQLTIHRILSELKTINDRIDKVTSEFKPVTVKRGVGSLINKGSRTPVSEEEFISNAKSGYQSVKDLIDRKFKLRSALLKANGSTKVTIAGKEYTISEAIEMKDLIQYRQQLLKKMRAELTAAQSSFDITSQAVDADFERMITPQIQGLTNKSDIAKIRDEYKETFYKTNEVKLVDPLNISNEIDKLDKEINDFTVEVDAALSTINATTVVEID